ncbi:MAG TPA: SufD family Fe-S cluster assembly protein [Steroidobacteraceae bacterium]|nr:SufD family Fe-S cluster assembly protein [Steroidobacteraceae bacterium]
MTIALPTNKDENWRYANLRPLARAKMDAVDAGFVSSAPIALSAPLKGYERWVFVDGRFSSDLSAPAADSCAALLNARDAGEEFSALLDASIASEGADFALARVNGARGDQVLHIAPPDGTQASIELTFVASAAAAIGTSYPRVQIHAGRNARLRIVERHVSAGSAGSAINSAFDVALRADASIDHCRLQNLADEASGFDTLTAHVGERANYRLRTITLGGLTSRSTILVKLAGRAARCELTAGSIANGLQTHDVFAEIEHAAADTVTRELYRGIATDRGKLGFNGKMIVRESAHGADSDQSLKTLLTGNGAEASVRPQLEIYTDRVRAKHGATTGKLDEQMLFYLLSRGIDRRTAQTLLQWAFIEDAISRMECAPLRAEIEQLVAAQLNEVSALEGLLGS